MEINLNLDPKIKYIVAVSGGLDSMVLLDLLRISNFNFVVVHFNHHQRASAINDETLVSNYCQSFNINYQIINLKHFSGNFQDSARLQRINHLIKVAKEHNTSFILTAHHLNDHLETIIMNQLNNKSLKAKSGLQPTQVIKDYVFIKPLLNFSKNELSAYATLNNIPFNHDETNDDTTYLRNHIRHNFVSNLTTNEQQHYLSLAQQFFKHFQTLRNNTTKLINNNAITLSTFNQQTSEQQSDIIAYFFETSHTVPKALYIQEIIKQLSSNKPNIVFPISNTYQLIKAYDCLKLIPLLNNEAILEYYFENNLINTDLSFNELCYNSLELPLMIRKRKNGDILHFNFGSKKLKDFLIDKKVPLTKRDHLNIVVDANDTIIFIPNLYKNLTLGNNNKLFLRIIGE